MAVTIYFDFMLLNDFEEMGRGPMSKWLDRLDLMAWIHEFH